MKCPFLKAASVKYCEASAYRKLLPKDATDASTERCSTADYVHCAAAAPRLDGAAAGDRCPFLHEAEAEFCGAASVTRFIPATTDLLSRCNSDGHLYCEVFMMHSDPQGEKKPRRSGFAVPATYVPEVDGIPVPPDRYYTPNHMWLDIAGDGYCHVGIDGFATRVLGSVDGVSFGSQRSLNHPTAVLHSHGVDVQMVFPNPLHVVFTNVYLRSATAKLLDDPYGAGWLFECVEPATTEALKAARQGLITGVGAVAWMRDEMGRLNDFAQRRIARPDEDGLRSMADGGTVEQGLAAHLDREEMLDLIAEFFTPQNGWRRAW